MLHSKPTALASAAETRRREMPASIALIILTGGLAAAIMGGVGAVGWAAVMSLFLIFDTELYRRLDARDVKLEGGVLAGLVAWAFTSSTFYAVLPVSLWLHGEAAGAAAAMVLWVAGVVRHVSPGASGKLPIAVAGALPPALSLLGAPLMVAAMTTQPDWDLAVIAAVGGGALMAYVTQARVSAQDAEAKLKAAAHAENLQNTLAQLVFDTGPLAAVLVDAEGRVVAMSKIMRSNLHVEEAVGRKFEDLIQWSPATWRDALARALTGEHIRYDEDEIRTADGARWFEWEVRPWRDSDGEICGVAAYGRDITANVLTRTAAAANEQRLKIALEAGRSIVWEVDFREKRTIWYGDAIPLYGREISYEDFMSNSTPLLHVDDRPALNAYFDEVAKGGQGCIEHRVIFPDGSIGWVEVWARRVLGRTGGVRKFVILSKDVTERKQQEAAFIGAMHRAEEALATRRALFDADVEAVEAIDEAAVNVAEMYERLDRLIVEMDARDAVIAETLASLRAAREAAEAANVSKSQFLTSMSHELRTPLNAIIGYTEILQEEAEADGRTRDLADLDRVLAAARQLLHLINDILDLSKIEAGKMEAVASDFSIAALIQEAAATVRPTVEKNGNTLRVEADASVGEAHSDPFKLNQCLLNLLSNAAKFTRGGEVSVRASRVAREGGEWIEIVVSDSGIGMNEEQVSRLFNAFVQADAMTARRYGGTGLGLALTRRMMQLLGGDVTVTSVVGQGSSFTLALPARLGAQAAHARVDLAASAGQGAQRVVLLIDDEETARDLAARSLVRLGFEVRGAASGEEGLALARALKPSLIVLDINLPDMTGWAVLEALAAPETNDIPVIVHSIDDDRQRALGAGAADHLVKPADRDVLAAAALRFARAPKHSEPAAAPAISTIAKTA